MTLDSGGLTFQGGARRSSEFRKGEVIFIPFIKFGESRQRTKLRRYANRKEHRKHWPGRERKFVDYASFDHGSRMRAITLFAGVKTCNL